MRRIFVLACRDYKDALAQEFEKQKVKLSSKLEQALTYMTKHRDELIAYVKIGTA